MINTPMHHQISVIVCTYNRAALLNRLMESLYEQTLDKKCWNVIIVDNNSPDETRKIVHQWQGKLATDYRVEIRQGLSFARNSGMELSNAGFLLYLDDDVYTEPTLLASYFKYINSNDMSNIACLGGKVLVEWEGGKKPDWFPEKLKNLYGHHDLGSEIVDSKYAVGCNMLWNREILIRLGKFPTNLGRKAEIKLASEETALEKKAIENGYHVKYIPEAVVYHWTPYSRQERRYLFNLCYWLGISISKAETLSMNPQSWQESTKKNLRLIRTLIINLYNLSVSFLKRPKIPLDSETVYWCGKSLLVTGNILQNIYRR